MDRELEIALAFLHDEISEPSSEGYWKSRKLTDQEVGEGRDAISRLLRRSVVSRDLLNALAEVFTDKPVSSLTRTKAYIRRKKGPWADRLRDFEIMNDVNPAGTKLAPQTI